MKSKENKTALIQARLTPAQKRRLRKMSEAAGATMSETITALIEAGPFAGLLDGCPEGERELMANVLNYANSRPDLRPLAFWLAGNRQSMLTHGHLLTPEERAHWQKFMSGLTRIFSEKMGADVDLERQKIRN